MQLAGSAAKVEPQASAPVSQTQAQLAVSKRKPTPQLMFWLHWQLQLEVLQVKLPPQAPPQSGGQTQAQLATLQTWPAPQLPPQSDGQTHWSVTGSHTIGAGQGPAHGCGLPAGLGVRSSQ